MTRIACVMAIVCGGLAVAAQQTPPFTSIANLVVVPAVVVDKKGQLVSTLTAADFQVFEDGKLMELQVFTSPDDTGAGSDGRFVVLVLDNVRTPAEIAHRVRDVATKFADRVRPPDTMGVVMLAGGRAFTTSSPLQVRAAIKGFTPAFGETIATPAQEAASGLQAIAELSQQLARSPHRRKVLVFIGSAGVFSPSEPSAFDDRGPNMSTRWLDAIRATATSNVSVYAIDPAGSFSRSEGYTENFAGQTGGVAWVGANNFNTAVERIWRESGSYYLLGYQAPINDHRLHKIEVRVGVSGLSVRARRGRG